jgi:leader peptidase (prepilin peptidase) / N-methyltransferase
MSGHVALIAGLALAGLALGWAQRPVIARYLPSERSVSPVLAGVVTGALFAALAARVPGGFVLGTMCALAVIAVPLAFIDAAVHRLPDALTGAAYLVTVAGLLLAAAAGNHWHDMVRAALGGLALAGFYLVLALVNMGMGDIKLAASIGTALAWAGWRALVFGGAAGFFLAAAYSIAMMAVGRLARKQDLPIGPFMIAGAFLLLLVTPA